MNKKSTVKELASVIGGEVLGDGDRAIDGANTLAAAGPGDLVYVDGERFIKALESSRAGAAIVPDGVTPPEEMSGIRYPHPALGMAKAVEFLQPRTRRFTEISPQAYMSEGVQLGDGVGVGPGAYLGKNVRVGANTEIYPGVTIGEGTTVGEDCVVHSGVHVYHECVIGDRVIVHAGVVIGADGYGFLQEPTPGSAPQEPLRHRKVPQIGRVVIEDDVEIGANSAIDRAALGETRIGKGTKIDNLVHVAHNVIVGRHCLLVGQSGTSGSTELGDYVTVAGQAGLVGHIKIGSRAIIGAQAGVVKDVKTGDMVVGSPAFDARKALKAHALFEHLPQFKKQLADHARRIERMESDDGEENESGG